MTRISRLVAFTLRNAVEHEGKASVKAVVPKVFSSTEVDILGTQAMEAMGYSEDADIDRKEIAPLVETLVLRINSIALEEQKSC